MNWERVWETARTQLTTFGLKVLGAIGDMFGEAGYPVPESHVRMKQAA